MDQLSRSVGAPSAEPSTALIEMPGGGFTLPAARQVIGPRGGGGDLPLSHAQDRLWFLAQLEPDTDTYHVPFVLELGGPLDTAAMTWALGQIVRRHEVLRTVFRENGDGPRAFVLPWSGLPVPVLDVRGAQDADAVVARTVERVTRTPFDLSEGPMLRAELVRIEDEKHLLVLCLHHIVFDAKSRSVFFDELGALYGARVSGVEAELAAPPIQYGDYAVWQRAEQGAALEESMDYWRAQLAGVDPVLQLPTDRPRPAERTFRAGLYEFEVPADVVGRVRALSRAHGVTMFSAVLAAFQIVLSRYTGRDDFLVGVPSANRAVPELDRLIGFFVNTLVLRADLRGDPTVEQLLDRVGDASLSALEHQAVPFERLVDEIAPTRDLSYTPLIQVLFSFLGGESAEPRFPGLRVRLANDADTDASAKFDLTLRFQAGSDGPGAAALAYNADLFDPETMAAMARHLGTVLGTMADRAQEPISGIPMLEAPERHRLTREWSDSGGVLEGPLSCLHHLIGQQVRATPDAIAVQFADETLTYQQLDVLANRVARRLIAAGVTTDDIVGVCAERSLAMIVSTLGVLKAGGAYLPLDPGYPRERLGFLIEDARATAIVAQEQFAELLDGLCGDVPLLTVGRDGASTVDGSADGDVPGTDPDVPVLPDNAAYVIYTSGSTGRPKGVVVGHGAICNNLLWMQRDWPLEAADRLLHKTAFTFDVSVKELFWPLLAGARLVLAHPDGHRDPAYLRDLIRDAGITVTHFVPSMLQAFLAEPGVADCRSLRLVMCGAEALPVRTHNEFFRLLGADLLHLYGPTEAAIAVTAWLSTGESEEERVPLGGPMPNCSIYLLDDKMEPVPARVPGHLHIAGVPLARGYLGDPVKTAQAFVPDPYSRTPGGRLYRTGDLARWRHDGQLEFLGRIDSQVKIRGLRIEPGEVEAVLSGCPGVDEAAVIVRTGGTGANAVRLVAYARRGTGATVTQESVREYLRARVPDYLVPAAVVVLDEFPRLPSGKLNREALPEPEWRAGAAVKAPPRTDAERRLAAIWCDVLGAAEVGVHDNFFDIGGDSLLSIQVVSRARRVGLEFTVRELFKHQTVAELAASLGGGAKPEAAEAVSGEAPLTPIQHRWFDQRLDDLSGYTQEQAFELDPAATAQQVRAAVNALADHHDMLRAGFARAGRSWRQEIAPPGREVPVAEVDFADVADDELSSRLGELAAQLRRDIDLGGGLLRAAVCRRGGAAGPVLLLVAHHLVVDGVSWRVLAEDLESALEALLAGRAPQLPGKTTSYRTWASALADYARSPRLRSEAVFWTKQAAAVPPLPLESSADGGPRVDVHTCAIDRHTADRLLHDIPAAKGFGARDVLLAAFAETVSEWSGAAELKLDLDSHGRTEIADDLDLSRTVGWFTAVYPLRLTVDPRQSPEERVRAVRERAEAVPEAGIGYGVIRHLRDDTVSRTLAAAAPAQLSFNYLGRFDSPTATRSGDQRPPLVRQLPMLDEGDRLIAAHHEYPLSLAVAAVDDEMTATWTYRSDLIRPETVRGLAEAWQEAVRRVVDGSSRQSPPAAAEERQSASGATVAGLAEDPLLLLAAGDPGAPELVLVHPVTGSPRGYTHLARLLGGTAAVHGLMAPGLSGEAAPLESVPELAQAYLAAMDAHGLAEPYRLVGWSFGGLVAYEMAARLTRRGRKVELLGVIDSAAPGGRTPAGEDLLGVLFAAEVGRTEPRGALELTAEDLAGAGPDGVAELVAGELARRRGDRTADWIPHVHALYLVFRAHMRAAAGYVPEPGGYPGDLLCIACETKTAVDRTVGWPEFVAGHTTRHVIPGDHYSIVEPPNVQALAGLLLPYLGRRTDAAG